MNASNQFPWILYLTEESQAEVWNLVKLYLRPQMEELIPIGNEDEKIRFINEIFTSALVSIIESGVTVCTVKDILKKMTEIRFAKDNFPLHPLSIELILLHLTWMDEIPIDLVAVAAVYNESLPVIANLHGQDIADKLVFTMLNAFTQVLLSSASQLTEHMRWTVMFSYVFYGTFLNIYKAVCMHEASIFLNSLAAPMTPVSMDSSSQTSPSSGERTPRLRGFIPHDVKAYLNDVYDQRNGEVTRDDIVDMAALFKDRISFDQIKVFYKNKRAKIRRMSRQQGNESQ